MAAKRQSKAAPAVQAAPDMASMFEAFAAFMAAQGMAPAAPAPVAPAKVPGGRSGTRKASAAPLQALADEVKRTRAKAAPAKAATGVITCGQAWHLLGGDPTYTPSNPAAPARNTQLWALNQRGLLTVKS